MAEFEGRIPIAARWGSGVKASADMMSQDASRHLWNARVEPRRRTYAVGIAWKFTATRARACIEVGTLTPESFGDTFFVKDNGAGFDAAAATSRWKKSFQPCDMKKSDVIGP